MTGLLELTESGLASGGKPDWLRNSDDWQADRYLSFCGQRTHRAVREGTA